MKNGTVDRKLLGQAVFGDEVSRTVFLQCGAEFLKFGTLRSDLLPFRTLLFLGEAQEVVPISVACFNEEN